MAKAADWADLRHYATTLMKQPEKGGNRPKASI